MKTLAEIVGKNIQTRRIEMGLHQRQLAEMIDAGGAVRYQQLGTGSQVSYRRIPVQFGRCVWVQR